MSMHPFSFFRTVISSIYLDPVNVEIVHLSMKVLVRLTLLTATYLNLIVMAEGKCVSLCMCVHVCVHVLSIMYSLLCTLVHVSIVVLIIKDLTPTNRDCKK